MSNLWAKSLSSPRLRVSMLQSAWFSTFKLKDFGMFMFPQQLAPGLKGFTYGLSGNESDSEIARFFDSAKGRLFTPLWTTPASPRPAVVVTLPLSLALLFGMGMGSPAVRKSGMVRSIDYFFLLSFLYPFAFTARTATSLLSFSTSSHQEKKTILQTYMWYNTMYVSSRMQR